VSDDAPETTEAPTRRDYVKDGGTLLTGCTGDAGSQVYPEFDGDEQLVDHRRVADIAAEEI
jgi:hypothetical protein